MNLKSDLFDGFGALRADTPTVASVTPVAVEYDSRTYKQAATLAANGFRSIVVEGVPSAHDWRHLPFTLISLPGARSQMETGRSDPPFPYRRSWKRWLRERWRALRRRGRSPTLLAPLFLIYLTAYSWRFVIRPLLCLPRADIYVLHEFSTFPAVRLRATLCRAQIVYDAHDFYSEIEPKHTWPPLDRQWLAPFHRRIERACIQSAAAVVTVSATLAAILRDRFTTEAVVLRNLHDPRLDREDAVDLRKRLDLPDDAFLLVTVGNCKRGQASKSALDALDRLPKRVHLAFVGDGYVDLAIEVDRRGLDARVHMAGRLPLDEIVPAVRSADASLILYYARSPNYEAALPNGLFQSIAAELPILYPRLPEIASLMRTWGIGIAIDPEDADSIAGAVSRIMTAREAAGAPQARRFVARAHEWAQEEAEFISVIRRALRPRDGFAAGVRRGERST